mmetsp:Transcript_78936/g.236530  ORF Transcript_78936/g.236530 Transcript_78936/m.236530 type:complete len:459 (+) Transcript_78936:23-1399(+)
MDATRALTLVLGATGPADNQRAARPPLGWRTWNQFQGKITQSVVEANMRVLADRSRHVDGVSTSLADLGYKDAGIDDGWQECGNYGPQHYRYHTGAGDPVVNSGKFPDLQRLTALAHSLNLTAGWYGNACGCVDGCCSDHCDSIECFAGDVNATLSLGFDSYKIDGCGAQRDIALWAELFNHSSVARSWKGRSMMIENCHDGDGDSPGANAPSRDALGELWCPFHTYRSSGDARPTFGSLLNNLNSTRAFASANLSVPGCWAYPDMMELGVTNTGGRADCGPDGNETCGPLSFVEARTVFGAWAIVSSPLVLGFDLTDAAQLELHWSTITNRDAIAVNQEYAGFSGSLLTQSAVLTRFTACDWAAGVSCEWPSSMVWYKPLGRRDARRSVMALLLMNNANQPAKLSVEWAAVPGLSGHRSCTVFDVWQRRSLGPHAMNFTAEAVAPRDSVFVTLSDCI